MTSQARSHCQSFNTRLTGAFSFGFGIGLTIGLGVGFSYWLLFGLFQGIAQEQVEDQDRHILNQGIRLSVYNSTLMAGLGGTTLGISCFLCRLQYNVMYFGVSLEGNLEASCRKSARNTGINLVELCEMASGVGNSTPFLVIQAPGKRSILCKKGFYLPVHWGIS